LLLLRRQIASKMLNGPGFEGAETHRRLLAKWEERVARLEDELGQSSPLVNSETVAAALPPDSALVEYARFTTFEFEPHPSGEPRQMPARYVAFVLRAGAPVEVALVDLGEAEQTDRLLSVTRLAFVRGDDLGPARALREGVFDRPAAAAGRRRLLLAFDGELVHVPFAALPGHDGRPLFDAYHLHGTTTGRDLLARPCAGAPASAPVVAGDPDFDLDARTAESPEPPPPGLLNRAWTAVVSRLGRSAAPSAKPNPEASDPSKLQFHRLGVGPTETLARLLGVRPWLGRQVLHERITGSRSPRILHLAAPGFFLAGAAPNAPALPRRDKLLERAGIALACANAAINGAPLPSGAGDGLLTTQDVVGLDLAATELVVLPACGAGVLELGCGPGVVALQRAFLLAGARSVVLTLWQPPADVGGELLADFYRRVLAGEGTADAFRAAQEAIKAKRPDPRGWAAFIAVGDH
jgi:hypothetical protein